jgi:hypothetical protein
MGVSTVRAGEQNATATGEQCPAKTIEQNTARSG